MLTTTLPAVQLITESAHHSTGPPSYNITGHQCTWPHGPRLAGANKVPGHTATTLSNGQTIYLASPFSTLQTAKWVNTVCR